MARASKRGVRRSVDRAATQHLERLLWDLGYLTVAGVDEVGLGPLAGPVVAAAVAFEPGSAPLAVADSKTVSASAREALSAEVRETARAVGVGWVGRDELDDLGVRAAGLEAMRRAVGDLEPVADYLLVDARTVPGVSVGQTAFVRADAGVHCVAAASIVAKVARDRFMVEAAEQFPGYGFERHMGYGTAAHLEALDRLGPCALHRRSFEPVRRRCGG